MMICTDSFIRLTTLFFFWNALVCETQWLDLLLTGATLKVTDRRQFFSGNFTHPDLNFVSFFSGNLTHPDLKRKCTHSFIVSLTLILYSLMKVSFLMSFKQSLQYWPSFSVCLSAALTSKDFFDSQHLVCGTFICPITVLFFLTQGL